MKAALIGINSRFIHKSLSIHSLHSAVKDLGVDFTMEEFSINEPMDRVFHVLYGGHYDVMAFSAYLWNKDYVIRLARTLRQVSPGLVMVVGGPDVTPEYEALDLFDYVVLGEGEEVLRHLTKERFRGGASLRFSIHPVDLEGLPFPYEGSLETLENKIVYYEGSRGCPFHCSYCLSGRDNHLRLKSKGKILAEIHRLVDAGVKQVKFIDRTFNANPDWALDIVDGLLVHGGKGCNFHFEVSIDKMDPRILALLETAPVGLFQLEIGVQSTHQPTLDAVHRHNDFKKIRQGVERLLQGDNIHLHTDLIVGLPYEDLTALRRSFNEIIGLKAHMLQVGFLKVIPNTEMRERAEELGLTYREYPPYEILSSPWISVDEMRQIKGVEEATEGIFNRLNFRQTFLYLLDHCDDPFELCMNLGLALLELQNPLSLKGKYAFLLERIPQYLPSIDKVMLEGALRLDWHLTAGDLRPPSFLRKDTGDRSHVRVVEFPFRFEMSSGAMTLLEKKIGYYVFDHRTKVGLQGYPLVLPQPDIGN